MPHPTDEPRLGIRLLMSLTGAGLVLALAVAAAHFYAPPSLNGGARQNPWRELDFSLALTSSLLALGVAAYAGRGVAGTHVFARTLGRAVLWITLTIVLAFSWRSCVSLSALLIAPSHAFVVVRLAVLWRTWRSEALWRK